MTPSTNGIEVSSVIVDELEDLETVEAVDTSEMETKGLPFNPRNHRGERTLGQRKMQLLGRLQMQCNKLMKKGINANYVLAKFTNWKGPYGTKTKQISGIISQLKKFEI